MKSSSKSKTLLACTVGILSSVVGIANVAQAEGSQNLYPTGATGSRANIEWRLPSDGLYGGILPRRSLFKVYAKAGETILLGSSAVGVGSGDILLYRPGLVTGPIGSENIPVPASATLSCNAQAVKGIIDTRAKELAGPSPAVGGYAPCSYTVPVGGDGIYDVAFTGPSGFDGAGNGNVTGSIDDNAGNFNTGQGTSISTWDVTVRTNPADPTTNQNGRLFTYSLVAFTGNNGRPINSIIYPVTTDGYQYKTEFKGLDPNGFVAFGNRSGFLNSDGTPLYHDALGILGGPNPALIQTIQGGVTMARPEFPIFFKPADESVLTTLGIPTTPTTPVLSNLQFTGTATTATSTQNTGGDFGFNTNVPGSYELVISNDGVDFDPTNPLNRVIRKQAPVAGTQTVAWDGKRNDGTFFPVNTTQLNYPVRATLRGGEYHFPLLDAENSVNGGPSFTMLNPPSSGFAPGFSDTTAFYDDRGYKTANGTLVGTAANGPLCATNNGLTPTPAFSNPVTGYSSTTNSRAYGAVSGGNNNITCGGGSFGDAKGLDLWTYFPSAAQLTQVIIIPSTVPKANATKYVEVIADTDNSASLTGGDRLRYTIVYNNTGTAAATGFQITDLLPTSVNFVAGSETIVLNGTGTTAASNPTYNGTTDINLLGANAVLGVNGTITVTIEATVNGTAEGDVFNQAKGTSSTPGYPPTGILTDTRDATTPGIPPTTVDQSIYPTGTAIDPTGVTVVTPKPVLNKSVKRLRDNDGTTTLTPGDDVQYTIVLRNPNPVSPIKNVIVSDAIPTQLQFLLDGANPVTVTGSPFVTATTLTGSFNGDGVTPIALTNSATLAPGATITVVFNAKILPGAASPIANHALVNYKGDLGTPIRSDASDSTNPTSPGSGGNSGTPDGNGDVTQPDGAPDDETIIKLVSPVNPAGTKSVRLVDDKDGSASVSIGDVVEYTVIYSNTSTTTAVNNFQITDAIDSTNLTFVPGSYTFAKSNINTTVPAQPSYNGTSDALMTGTGTLEANSSVTVTYRATIIAPANTVIRNQASATSSGPNSPSFTDAVSGPKDEPQIADDGVNTGNIPGNTGDDEPNLLTVKEPGEARLKLVKRVTGVTRNGGTIAGLNFNQSIEDSQNAMDIKNAGLTPFGLPEVTALTPLRSGDEAEYTIYFLSDGKSFSQNVAICDLIPDGTTFVPNSFGNQQGITLRANSLTTSQTNAIDTDPGAYAPSLSPLPTNNGCSNPSNPNGATLVKLGTVSNVSTGNVGFFRFRVRIN